MTNESDRCPDKGAAFLGDQGHREKKCLQDQHSALPSHSPQRVVTETQCSQGSSFFPAETMLMLMKYLEGNTFRQIQPFVLEILCKVLFLKVFNLQKLKSFTVCCLENYS